MEYSYRVSGTCSREVRFEIDENEVVHNVKFIGGCSGNTQGVARLAEGMKADELINRLEGVLCGIKDTSCPDQFAKALKDAVSKRGC